MINVTKRNGSTEPYSEAKLRRSLRRAGADNDIIDHILEKVKTILYNGIETKKLFTYIFNELKKTHPPTSSKYNIKKAILNLGRQGFIFEKYIARILQQKGYVCKLNQYPRGAYISHEIDIDAQKNDEHLMVECKHHMFPWISLDIKTALYVYARYLDLKKTFNAALLVTNTTFSEQVIMYSKGVGLQLMGWKYPKENSLEHNIETYKLYPITMLPGINPTLLDRLAAQNIITLKDFLQARKLPIGQQQLTKMTEQARDLTI